MAGIRTAAWLLLGLLLAASLIPAPGAAAPEAVKSKLTIHTSFTGGESMKFIQNAQPTTVKILGGPGTGSPWDKAATIKAVSPGTVIVGRIYFADEPATGDAVTRAREWWDRCRGVILAYPQVDYWEGYNEPSVDSVARMQWLAQFDAERVRILAQNNRKAAIGSFSVGTPEVVKDGQPFGDYWRAFYPAIDAARVNGGVLSLHEYSAPSMQYAFDAGSGDGWLTGRYRKVYNWFLKPDGRQIPLIITECGIDGGTRGWGQKGWKSYASGSDYLEQLKWYDSLLKQDSYVLGATIFSLEIHGWDDFDIAPIIGDLTTYVKAGGSVPPSPPPAGRDNTQFLSQQVPDTMTAGQKYTVSVTMKNTGTSTWTAGNNYRLGSQNPQDNKYWGTHRVYLDGGDSIAPGQQKTFTFSVTAPSAAGKYNFQWRMLRESVAWFGDSSTNTVINVVAAAPNNAEFIGQNVQTVMAADQKYTVSVTMKNTGSATWTPGNNYRLGSQYPQDNRIWLRTTNRVYLNTGESIGPGQQKIFSFIVTAPSTAGTYHFQWQMLREMVAWFGQRSADASIQILPKNAPVSNAGFEQGTTGWSGFRATASAVGTTVHSGAKAFSLTATGPAYPVKGGVSCNGGFNTVPYVAVAPNTRYTASVWVRAFSSPGEAMIYVQQFSGTAYTDKIKSPTDGFAYDVLATGSVKSGDGWVQLSVPLTTTASTRYVSISLNGNTAGVPLIFDDVSLVAG